MAYNAESLDRLDNMNYGPNLISFTGGVNVYHADLIVESKDRADELFDEVINLWEDIMDVSTEDQIVHIQYANNNDPSHLYLVIHEGVPYITFNIVEMGTEVWVVYNQQLLATSDYTNDLEAKKVIDGKVSKMNDLMRAFTFPLYAEIDKEPTL